jgi:hypothetical protein
MRAFAHPTITSPRAKIPDICRLRANGTRRHDAASGNAKETFMSITVAHISPLVALVAGILILLIPRLLNYIVAIYLILVGIMGFNSIHHFIR